MNRIPLTRAQRSELQAERVALEAEIRMRKASLRQPHTANSGQDMEALAQHRKEITAIYTLIAASRGRAHTADAEEALLKYRQAAKDYTRSWTRYRGPLGHERAGQMLLAIDAAQASAGPPIVAPEANAVA